MKNSKYDFYKDEIDKIEYNQRHGDAFWGHWTFEETERGYSKLEQLIRNEQELTEESKKNLLDIIKEKRAKMPQIQNQVQKEIQQENELRNTAKKDAQQRYDELNFLKKMKLQLLKQDPKHVEFDFLDTDEINNLYPKKR